MTARETTSAPEGPKGRTYGDACGTALALDVVGERWALLVVRELLLGPKRFTDLKAGLPGVSSNVLAERLDGLERAGVLHRRRLPPPAASRVYELTGWGMELEPVVASLGRWGARTPWRPEDAAIGADALVLSFRTMFDPRAAEGLEARYELRLGEDRYRARVAGGRFEILRGAADRTDATVESDPATLAALVYEGLPLADAVRSGDAKVGGDKKAVERFLGLFRLPEPATPAAPA